MGCSKKKIERDFTYYFSAKDIVVADATAYHNGDRYTQLPRPSNPIIAALIPLIPDLIRDLLRNPN